MAIAEVSGQRATSAAQNNVDSVGLAFPLNVTAGNLLVVMGGQDDAGGPTAVTDSQGNTYTVFQSGAGGFIAIAVAGSSGACTVTVNPDTTSTDFSFTINEYSGQHATPLHVDDGETTGTDISPTATLTTTVDACLILAVMSHSGADTAIVPPAGSFTEIGQEPTGGVTGDPHSAVHQLGAAIGDVTPLWILSASRTWSVYMLAIKPAVAATVTYPPVIAELAGSFLTPSRVAVLGRLAYDAVPVPLSATLGLFDATHGVAPALVLGHSFRVREPAMLDARIHDTRSEEGWLSRLEVGPPEAVYTAPQQELLNSHRVQWAPKFHTTIHPEAGWFSRLEVGPEEATYAAPQQELSASYRVRWSPPFHTTTHPQVGWFSRLESGPEDAQTAAPAVALLLGSFRVLWSPKFHTTDLPDQGFITANTPLNVLDPALFPAIQALAESFRKIGGVVWHGLEFPSHSWGHTATQVGPPEALFTPAMEALRSSFRVMWAPRFHTTDVPEQGWARGYDIGPSGAALLIVAPEAMLRAFRTERRPDPLGPEPGSIVVFEILPPVAPFDPISAVAAMASPDVLFRRRLWTRAVADAGEPTAWIVLPRGIGEEMIRGVQWETIDGVTWARIGGHLWPVIAHRRQRN